jgi:ketosteroid isomerase-like protein
MVCWCLVSFTDLKEATMHPSSIDDELQALERRWTEAETTADAQALEELAAGDFMLIGPAGFVLDRQQWVDRYQDGDLVTHTLSFEPASTRVYGDLAVTIGRHVQTAAYQGRPVDGAFRATHLAVRDEGGWRLAGMHLSPIVDPAAR